MRTRSNSYGKKKIKIKDENFEILKPCEYLNFLNYEYNVKQLKTILKSYKLKISGNKNELTNRVYNFMKHTYFVILIQSKFRQFLINKFYNIIKCNKSTSFEYNNGSDFYTMENINDINKLYIYTYKDSDNFYYAFKISSLILHIESDNDKNPYNRSVFSDKLKNDIRFIKNIYNIYSNLCENIIEEEPILSRKQKNRLKIVELFQKIDSLGNYSDINWLLNLNKRQIIYFIRELYDIWNYRSQLTDEIKRQIYPPTGRPFFNIPINTLNRHQDFNFLIETCIKIISNFMECNTSDSNKGISALYILSALTLVSDEAADSLPWLYQSVAMN